MFKYENVSDGAIDYESEEYFVGIAAVVENASEYRKVRYRYFTSFWPYKYLRKTVIGKSALIFLIMDTPVLPIFWAKVTTSVSHDLITKALPFTPSGSRCPMSTWSPP